LPNVRFTFEPHPELPALPRLNVGSVIGGRGPKYVLHEPPYVPDFCTAMVDVHFVPGQTVDGILADIRRVLDALVREDPQLRYEIEIPPPASFKGRRRLVMNPIDVPQDSWVVQALARNHRQVMGHPPATIGAILPMSYSAGDACWLWGAGIPSVYYGPRGGFLDQGPDGAYMFVSEMVDCAKVLALTALEACG
ncbi:MAG TPA: peptidase dimerization domain-containing protein, partial [Myxococcaceae bacterium]